MKDRFAIYGRAAKLRYSFSDYMHLVLPRQQRDGPSYASVFHAAAQGIGQSVQAFPAKPAAHAYLGMNLK